MIKSLDVYLQNQRVGRITLLPGENTLFNFEKDYIENPARLTLSQSFLSQEGQLITQTRPIHTRLHPFFSNLLPEGHLREYLAAKNNVNPKREFSLIEALGSDLPGAIFLQPSSDSQQILESGTSFKNVSEENDHYRFSLAGIQLKFSALASKKGGLTIPASGIGGTWIVKLPSLNHAQVPENEYAMMTLAKIVGIDVPDCHLVALENIEGLPDLGPLQGQSALAVKRFDRGPDESRIHMEDFSQVYGVFPEKKYDDVSYTNIANMIWTLCGEQDLVEYIKRLVFSILIGNGDMHLKNWSFIYPDGRTPQLSPAYDLLSTIPYIPGDTLALTFVKTKQMQLCDEDMFMAFADKAKLPKHLVQDTLRQTVELTRTYWPQLKREIDLDPHMINLIDNHMNSISL